MELIKSVVWVIYRTLTYLFNKIPPPRPWIGKFYRPLREQIPDLQALKQQLEDPNIKIISFDLFDTLLYRPCWHPTDLFHLIAQKVNKIYHIDFFKLRIRAEKYWRNPYISLEEIYANLQHNTHLTPQETQRLKQEELACEKQLLTVRHDIMEIYNYACKLHKRIIVVSDMYLPASFLAQVLYEKGYTHIDKIYVSNEWRANKHNGALFKKVLQQEQIQPQQMLHIGDNKKSDYIIPRKQQIRAVYYPSIKAILCSKKSIYGTIQRLHPGWSADPLTRMLISFALFREFQNSSTCPQGPALVDNMQQLTSLCLAPLLFYTAHYIATNPDIQKQYNHLFFLSRDGFLPQIAYNVLRKYIPAIDCSYLYAGRRAYYPLFFDSFEAFVSKAPGVRWLGNTTFEQYLSYVITDPKTMQALWQKIPPEILHSNLKDNFQNCIQSLLLAKEELDCYMQQIRRNAAAYYTTQFAPYRDGRMILFDLGYSGSASKAFMKLFKLPIDKIFYWQTQVNKKADKINHTRTFSLMYQLAFYSPFYLLYEETFCPLQGSCLGFDGKQQPILENLSFPDSLHQTFDCIEQTTRQFMQDICKRFGPYLPYLSVKDSLSLHLLLFHLVALSPFQEEKLFKDIVFPDPLGRELDSSLEDVLKERKLSFILHLSFLYAVSFVPCFIKNLFPRRA